jgi:hypothetical protein
MENLIKTLTICQEYHQKNGEEEKAKKLAKKIKELNKKS